MPRITIGVILFEQLAEDCGSRRVGRRVEYLVRQGLKLEGLKEKIVEQQLVELGSHLGATEVLERRKAMRLV